jgi:hypothetical protein
VYQYLHYLFENLPFAQSEDDYWELLPRRLLLSSWTRLKTSVWFNELLLCFISGVYLKSPMLARIQLPFNYFEFQIKHVKGNFGATAGVRRLTRYHQCGRVNQKAVGTPDLPLTEDRIIRANNLPAQQQLVGAV